MINTGLLTDTDSVESLAKELLGSRKLPHFLFEEDEYERIVIELKEGFERIGIAYGVAAHGSGLFILHFLYIKKEYRTRSNTVYLLSSVLKTAGNLTGIKGAIWKYSIKENENDLRSNLLADISFCRVRGRERSSMQIRIKTKDFEHIRRFKAYKPRIWKEKGYGVLKWSECDDGLKNRIREREKEKEKNYLSPFVKKDDSGWEVDERVSLVITRSTEGDAQEPMGWLMCKRISKNEVTIWRFYMYEKERFRIIAHSFLSYALEVIALSYDYIMFDVAASNRQMQMLVRNYLEPIIESHYIWYDLGIDFIH